jgi:hypothetical protein
VGAEEVETFSIGAVDDASVGVDEAIVSTGDVDAAVESVDVVATWARTGLTMTNPIMSVRRTAKTPRNPMMLVFINLIKRIRLVI